MSVLGDVSCLIYLLGQYFAWRARLRKNPPQVREYYVRGLHGLDAMFGWTRKARVRGAERCPRQGPAIFASNHVQVDDPFVVGALIHEISGGIRPGAMMRDDFFRAIPRCLRRVLDPDEVACLIGAAQISRRGATPAQIQQFVQMLLRKESFIIYPGRTRTRSGMVFEYRGWIGSPGRTSLFPALARDHDPDCEVPVTPVTRTCNILTRRSCVVFGPALYLARGATESEQREFDRALVCAIADQIEVNAPHVLSAIAYLRCLHNLSLRADAEELADALRHIARTVAERNSSRMLDPALLDAPEREVETVMRFWKKKSIVRRNGGRFEFNAQAVLSAPERSAAYRTQNPVKYMINQMIHMNDVVAAVHERVLGRPAARRQTRAAV